MRPLTRQLFTFCTAASLVLFVIVCLLWVRGHFAMDMLIRESPWLAKPGTPCRQTVLSSTIGQLNLIRGGVDVDGRRGPDARGGAWRYGLMYGDGEWRLVTIGPSWHSFVYSFNRVGFAWGRDEYLTPPS